MGHVFNRGHPKGTAGPHTPSDRPRAELREETPDVPVDRGLSESVSCPGGWCLSPPLPSLSLASSLWPPGLAPFHPSPEYKCQGTGAGRGAEGGRLARCSKVRATALAGRGRERPGPCQDCLLSGQGVAGSVCQVRSTILGREVSQPSPAHQAPGFFLPGPGAASEGSKSLLMGGAQG